MQMRHVLIVVVGLILTTKSVAQEKPRPSILDTHVHFFDPLRPSAPPRPKDGKRIASTSEDATVKIWAVDTGKELATLRGHKDAVMSVAFSPDGERVISGSKRVARIWSVA